jgi:RecB family endonuclease NucS
MVESSETAKVEQLVVNENGEQVIVEVDADQAEIKAEAGDPEVFDRLRMERLVI